LNASRRGLESRCVFIRRKSRDPVLRGICRCCPVALVSLGDILPCRWPRARRAVASPTRTNPARWPLLLSRQLFPAASIAEDTQVKRPSHEVLLPTARQTSRSDCHPTSPFPLTSATRRVCLTRLRYAFRFSQPLDVLFLSKPFQPCFVLVALMGFHLRRFPLPSSCAAVSRHYSVSSSASPSAGSSIGASTSGPGSGIWASRESVAAASFTRNPRPVPPMAFFSPRVHPSAWACASERRY
jgi:hypothetical protein